MDKHSLTRDRRTFIAAGLATIVAVGAAPALLAEPVSPRAAWDAAMARYRAAEAAHKRYTRDVHDVHLRAGEFIIIDPEDRDPADGELFAITWKSDWRRRWQIVRMDQRWGRYGKTGHSTACEERNLWFVGEVTARPMMNLAGQRVGEPVRWADGPYDDAYCRDICHGKIIGIYAPDFRAKLKERA